MSLAEVSRQCCQLCLWGAWATRERDAGSRARFRSAGGRGGCDGVDEIVTWVVCRVRRGLYVRNTCVSMSGRGAPGFSRSETGMWSGVSRVAMRRVALELCDIDRLEHAAEGGNASFENGGATECFAEGLSRDHVRAKCQLPSRCRIPVARDCAHACAKTLERDWQGSERHASAALKTKLFARDKNRIVLLSRCVYENIA